MTEPERVMDDRPFHMPPREVHPWPAGPWDDEPDFESWVEPETGYRCCVMRNPLGTWCGYVRVPPESLLTGMDRDERVDLPPGWGNKRMPLDDIGAIDVFGEMLNRQPGYPVRMLVAVHGGITYCQDDWWGFDCIHSDDYSPGIMAVVSDKYRQLIGEDQTYRTLPYVRHEATQLAWQLKELSDALAAVAKERLNPRGKE